MIKNKNKTVDDHLKLYFYYINIEQKLVIMYQEIIFTRIKTEKCKVTEVKLLTLGLKQVAKIAFVEIKSSKKGGLCWV